MTDTAWASPDGPGAPRPEQLFCVRAADGTGLRAALWGAAGQAPPRGLALVLPGRAEFLEKVALGVGPLIARGFAVASLDWRGQGRSDRLAVPRAKGHVTDFHDYVRDLEALVAAPELAGLGPPRLVLGHSMGGLIAVMATAEGRIRVPLLLSAPMFGIVVAPAARRFAGGLGWLAERVALGALWPPVPGVRRPYPLSTSFGENLLTGDREAWDWMVTVLRRDPALGIGFPTLGWLRAAERAMLGLGGMGALGVPGMAFYGSAEQVVSPQAVEAVSARLGFGAVRLEGARHEPLIDLAEHRAAAWAAADRFFAGAGI
ncbi:alpha/beta hydrolase [Paralimibaculum aggregatum]|uniref:Alpha/beta hydrolase n=1 Tax=Paralimibaculum aggregatum TaxID=3036245 RepID=A0ABQ6LNF7_9RHOB|nr:alpha/beta hydrolase [Limibaculum sp. NKW23]GMG83874.1 alpha/beta hydrolase [Limibaculum sp. NKW23]